MNLEILFETIWTSVAQSSGEAPFTSEIVGSILALRTCVKRVSALLKVVCFLRVLQYSPTGKVDRVG
jgi:hypothetical protein